MEVFKTYEEWNEEGYHVIKGQKAKLRNNNGVALFSENQVSLKEKYFDYSDYSGFGLEDDWKDFS